MESAIDAKENGASVGREGGRHGLEECLDVKSVFLECVSRWCFRPPGQEPSWIGFSPADLS